MLTSDQKIRNLKPMYTDTPGANESLVNQWMEILQQWQMEIDFWQEEFNLLKKLHNNCTTTLSARDDNFSRAYQELQTLMAERISLLKTKLERCREELSNPQSDKQPSVKRTWALRKQLNEFELAYKKVKINFLEGMIRIIPIAIY